MTSLDKPVLDVLGADLLAIHPLRRVMSLAAPFLLVIGFFVSAAVDKAAIAIACTMLLTFLTYGSTSHDLVHRTLGLPRALNEGLLCAIELVCFRSGHAYRVTHLHHHAKFPAADDLEGAAAGMTWWLALIDGMTLQPRLWAFAFQRKGHDRVWMIAEAIGVIGLLAASSVAVRWTVVPALYAALMVAGSWLFPLITSFIPHNSRGESELTQTRLFRGLVLSVVALQHLYHLEHHLYPRVPHHNWPELARRLDPYFALAGVRPIRLFV